MLALWVTNRERLRRFVDMELLPRWGLETVATWFWLKVTDSGQLVSPLVTNPHPCIHMAASWLAHPPCALPVSHLDVSGRARSSCLGCMIFHLPIFNIEAVDQTVNIVVGNKSQLFLAGVRQDRVEGKRECAMQELAHRRPYEVLLLARPRGSAPPGGADVAPRQQQLSDMAFLAVPGEHSRKPHLGRLLAPLLPPQPACLEVKQRLQNFVSMN